MHAIRYKYEYGACRPVWQWIWWEGCRPVVQWIWCMPPCYTVVAVNMVRAVLYYSEYGASHTMITMNEVRAVLYLSELCSVAVYIRLVMPCTVVERVPSYSGLCCPLAYCMQFIMFYVCCTMYWITHSGVAMIFGPPPQTTCLGPWPRVYGDYFFLVGPFNPAGPSRGLRGPRYATDYTVFGACCSVLRHTQSICLHHI